MLTCCETVSRMTDLECGELPGRQSRETRRHLAGCPSCLNSWRGYRTSVALVRQAFRDGCPANPGVPEDFVETVVVAARARSGSLSRAAYAVHLLSGIAAAPLLAFYFW